MFIRFFLSAIILLFHSLASAGDETAKLAIPDDTAQRAASKLIGDVYKTDYDAAKTPLQKAVFAKKLIAEGQATKDDPVGQYVLLRIGRDMAAQQGDVATAFLAIDGMAERFEVDPLQLKADAVQAAVKAIRPRKADAAFLAAIDSVIDLAIAEDQYEIGVTVAGHALTLAKDTRDPDQVKRFVAKVKELQEIQEQFASVTKAQATLETNPTDPETNYVVGWFYCSAKGQWELGVPMLSLGSDESLKQLATAELAEMPEALKIADDWWAVAEKQQGSRKARIEQHAADWYRKALPTATGLTKARIESRLNSSFAKTKELVKAKEPAWQSLLDGNPSSWKHFENVQAWTISKNEIVTRGETSHLFYQPEQFGDFELQAEVKYDPGSNGGIFFRCQPTRQPRDYPVGGYEVQINSMSSHNPTGSLIEVKGDPPVAVSPKLSATGKWLTLHIVAKGNRITVRIDGKEALSHVDTNKPTFSGYVALQSLGGVVRYRNLKIRPIGESK